MSRILRAKSSYDRRSWHWGRNWRNICVQKEVQRRKTSSKSPRRMVVRRSSKGYTWNRNFSCTSSSAWCANSSWLAFVLIFLFLRLILFSMKVASLGIIQQHIRPGTRIISDMWAAYNGIQNLPQNYGHGAVNHRYNFIDPNDPTIHTQNIENTWLHFKRMHMKKPMGCKTELFGTYLADFMWRRRFGHNQNGNNQPQLLLHNLWSQIRDLYPCEQWTYLQCTADKLSQTVLIRANFYPKRSSLGPQFYKQENVWFLHYLYFEKMLT